MFHRTEEVWASADGFDGNECLGIIIRAPVDESPPNAVTFFTRKDEPLQVGYVKYPAGHAIQPHYHRSVDRRVRDIPEVLLVRAGRLRVDFYGFHFEHVRSVELGPEDVVILRTGAHGFQVLEDVVLYEVRQGPYLCAEDKQRFEPKDGPAAASPTSPGPSPS